MWFFFYRKWFDERKRKTSPSLMWAVAKAFWPELLVMGILCFISDIVVRLILPYQLEGLLSYYSKNSNVSRDDALKYGTAIFIITISFGISVLHYFYFAFYYGARLRVAVCSLIYRKVYNRLLSNHIKTDLFAMIFAVSTAIAKCFERYVTWKTG